MSIRFTFSTSQKINTIKAFREATIHGHDHVSLLFAKNMIENGIVTNSELEAVQMIEWINEARRISYAVFDYRVETYGTEAEPVSFSNRYI